MSEKTMEQRVRAFELLDFLEKNEDRHDQRTFLTTGLEVDRPMPSDPMPSDTRVGFTEALEWCGTTACAAGWACLLAGGRAFGSFVQMPGTGTTWHEMWQMAGNLLGLNYGEVRWRTCGTWTATRPTWW
jgi:hypothetical protein